ncbi:hypothetical protein SEUCBS140593_006684 [Sporothrix eucalyptigena]|uniref:Uncharacterized protein n=1 Tax=Sporothrix eucalyptigena TaxID=1812306 RepID=A0ABP0C917_9PEZI
MQSAVEGEEQEYKGAWTPAHARCDLLAATEWMIHGGTTLYRWARENNEDVENDAGYDYSEDVPPGPLFTGRAGLSVARWNFWKARFREMVRATQEQPPGAPQTFSEGHMPQSSTVLAQSATTGPLDTAMSGNANANFVPVVQDQEQVPAPEVGPGKVDVVSRELEETQEKPDEPMAGLEKATGAQDKVKTKDGPEGSPKVETTVKPENVPRPALALSKDVLAAIQLALEKINAAEESQAVADSG